MTALGISFFAASVLTLAWLAVRGSARAPFPMHGWLGMAVWPLAGLAAWWGAQTVKVFLTPIVWTGYVLAIDAAVFRAKGRSMLVSDRRGFGWMALVSVGLWIVFEAYNLRLQNWRYDGLPESVWFRTTGYVWSFGTIWPAVLETAELLLLTTSRRCRQCGSGWAIVGAVLLILPAALPAVWGVYLFGLVWLGFIFLLEPINQRAGRSSIWGDWNAIGALCLAGLICGFVWEFWNYWAQARWVYVFPLWQEWKIFEMPVMGYLGFPAFALEVYVMYVYVSGVLRLPYHEIR
jgi:hypothetical protein